MSPGDQRPRRDRGLRGLGAQPAVLVATKHAAIAARIMCRHAAGQEGHDAGKPKRQPTHADLFFSNPRMKRSGWGDWSHPESTPHGLRDFSPGASAISAMRPPFSATQEFFVSGYLSV